MDGIDKRLLGFLMHDSRTPTTMIAKHLKQSREFVTYRLRRLEKNVILRYVTEIDPKQMGFIGAAVFIAISYSIEKQFRDFLQSSPYVSWVAELSGKWSYGFSLYAQNINELHERFSQIMSRFEKGIINHRFTLHQKTEFMYEKYFSEIPREKKIQPHSFDAIDKKILSILAKNARTDAVKIAKQVGLTSPAIATRLRKLHRSGITHSLFVDLKSAGLMQYSVFISNKKVSIRASLLEFLRQNKAISFIATYTGEEFIECGVFVTNPYELKNVLQHITEQFPDNIILEVSLFHSEMISVGPPECFFTES